MTTCTIVDKALTPIPMGMDMKVFALYKLMLLQALSYYMNKGTFIK